MLGGWGVARPPNCLVQTSFFRENFLKKRKIKNRKRKLKNQKLKNKKQKTKNEIFEKEKRFLCLYILFNLFVYVYILLYFCILKVFILCVLS